MNIPVRTRRTVLGVVSAMIMVLASAHTFGQSLDYNDRVDLKWGVKIPMRDRVKLNATVYLPHGVSERVPVIFTLTPYVGDTYHDRAMYFAEHGYIFVLVDVRGRGNSEGTFEPYSEINTGRDGYDIVEWLARQPWCNGKVAMWGGSYAGLDQWTTAARLPPHLVTIVPAATAHPILDNFAQNIFDPRQATGWLASVAGVTLNLQIGSDGSFRAPKLWELDSGLVSLRRYDSYTGYPSKTYQEWVDHPTPDRYWTAMLPTPEQYRRMNIPILNITGYFDSLGGTWFYDQLLKYGSPDAISKQYLILGPWNHPGTRTPAAECCGQKFGPESMVDLNDLHRQWYDWTMKGGPKPAFLKDQVAYYEPGPEAWRYAENLNAIPATAQTFYLGHGAAERGSHVGTLAAAKPDASIPDTYSYDPLDMRRMKDDLDDNGMVEAFGNGLIYETEPFVKNTQITGSMRFVAWMSIDVPDTDFYVTVYEVQKDGKTFTIGVDSLRARYRESLLKETLVGLGVVNKYEFNNFHIGSKQISEGSRLRLVLTSTPWINHEKNYNSGGVVADETAKSARMAKITLYHDAAHPSFLELPVVR